MRAEGEPHHRERTQMHGRRIAIHTGVTSGAREASDGSVAAASLVARGPRERRAESGKGTCVRVVLAGLSARLAAGLRTVRCEVERTGTAQQTLRALHR